MAHIVAQFTYYAYILEVPGYIEKEAEKIQRQFDKWLYDKDNNHGLWVKVNNRKVAVNFVCQDFVDYLNRFVIKDGETEAVILSEILTSDYKPTEQVKILIF